MVIIIVNAEPLEMPDGQTVHDLVVRLSLDGHAVAVEVNRKLVPKKQHKQTTLRDGDRVEVVTLVGGG